MANNNDIEKRLWDAADQLRANSELTAQQYSVPVLGLIFLRYADHKFTVAEKEIAKKQPAGSRRKVGKADYQARGVMFLPDKANYLWIQYFLSALNEKGRAGFVMANSASDARQSELDIRQKMIEDNVVDVMISIGSNFFYTVTLPCPQRLPAGADRVHFQYSQALSGGGYRDRRWKRKADERAFPQREVQRYRWSL